MKSMKQRLIDERAYQELHQYNAQGIEAIAQLIRYKWVQCGRPKEPKDNEEFKHFWIWVTGLIQRLWEVLVQGKV